MIFSELSPNTTKDDFRIVLKRLFSLNTYLQGHYRQNIREYFKSTFHFKYITTYSSGRSALYSILTSLRIGEGDEVILQAFTCVAASNPIIWTGAKPIFVDIDPKFYTISLDDLKKKITNRTKAIIVQHTFGYPAEINEIIALARPRNIKVIEDCAHTIGGEFEGEKLGTFGDASFFSFGRDKAISASFGGVAVTNDKVLGQKLQETHKTLPFPKRIWIARQLLYTIVGFLTREYYKIFSLGKLIHFIASRLGIIQLPTSRGENSCAQIPQHAPSQLPDALAHNAYHQLEKLDMMNRNRSKLYKYYLRELSKIKTSSFHLPSWSFLDNVYPIRLPMSVYNRKKLMRFAQNRGIILGNWYEVPVAPKAVDLKSCGYEPGSCPKAEEACRNIVNLPIHGVMSSHGAEQVVDTIREYLHQVKL